MIKPTVGRVMWYHPGDYANDLDLVQYDKAQPMAAHVAYVWNDHMVNLLVIDHKGAAHQRKSVPIVQEGSPYTVGRSPYCEWMPYQKGQAAKAEELEKKIAAP
jgi:hypothetical protein